MLEENLRSTESLKEDIGSLGSIAEWIQWWLSQQNWMLLGRNFEFIENMPPNVLHVVPVLNDSVLNWPIQFQDSLEFLCGNVE